MSISRRMAEIAINTTSQEITDKADDATKKLILDTLGTIIAGYSAPGIQPILEQINDWSGKSESHILVYGDKVPAPNAAFMNSSMAHALDFDDVHIPGAALHIMSSVLPVTLATAEITHSSGIDVLSAVTMGVEVAARLGSEYGKRRVHNRFLPATIIGGFGATTSACRILNLTVDETVNAFGIYYAQNSGNRQALFDKALSKRIQPAFAAQSAIWAAFLAKRGITGPENAFEGKAGLYRIYGCKGEPPSEDTLAAGRDFFEIERTSIKRFPSCGAAHPVTLAALDLAVENDLKPEDIEKVEVYLGEGGNSIVGMPFHMGANPQVNAQFSALYAVALALIRKRVGLAEFTDEQIRKDKETARLAKQITVLTHWEFEFPPKTQTHIVRVRTKSGKTLTCSRTREDILHHSLFSYEDVVKKFHDCAQFSEVCPSEKADSIVDLVREFEKVTDAEDFVKKNLLLL